MSDLKERLTEGLHHCGMCGQQAVEINSRGQWICTACLNEVRPDYMSALRMEAVARIEELEAALAAAMEALEAFEEFDKLPVAAKRPDVFEINVRQKLLSAIRALKSTTQP